MVNGIIRDMTAEEEADFVAEHEKMPAPWEDNLSDEEALEILLGGADE